MASPEVEHLIQLREHHARELQRCDDALSLLKSVGQQLQRVQSLTARVQARVTGQSLRSTPGVASAIMREQGNIQAPIPAREIDRLFQLATARGFVTTRSAVSSAFYVARKAPPAQVVAPQAPAPATGHRAFEARSPLTQFVVDHADLSAGYGADAKRLFALARAQGIQTTLRAVESARGRYKRSQQRTSKASKASKSAQLWARKKTGDRPTDRIRSLFRSVGTRALSREQVAEMAKLSEVTRDPRYTQQTAAMALKSMIARKEVRSTKDGYVAYRLPSSNGATAP